MPIHDFFKSAFDALSVNDALGHPNGEIAFGYLRVSSSGQAEDGRSGLPRQVTHLHEIASKQRLRIPWGYVFADDDSGFDFVHRPDLSRLRQEYRNPERSAHAVVIEHLDRLSRNADWHQGFLLDEMKQFGLKVVFWKTFSSRIEQAVMGAIAQDDMEKAKQRMMEGNLHKARSGRVTAKVAAYGYKFVDSMGQEGPAAKRDTHYAIREDEAEPIRYIYRKVIEGYPMRRIAVMLEGKYPPPKRFKYWEPKMVAKIIKKPLYKGEFIAHQMMEIKVPAKKQPDNLTEATEKLVAKRVQRPRDEWIVVPVPAIVSLEDWEKANQLVANNIGRRKPKHPFLLTGLVICATCGYQYIGRRKVERREEKEYVLTNYRCAGRANRVKAVREKIGCDQKQTSMRRLDESVWTAIYEVLLHPEIMIDALEREYQGETNNQLRAQIDFLERQIREAKQEDGKMYKAYLMDAFDADEYSEHRSALKDRLYKLQDEARKLTEKLMSPEELEEKKQEIYMICQNAEKSGLVFDAPFDVQKNIITTIVDKIILDANASAFEIQGVLRGQYLFNEDGIVDIGNGGGGLGIKGSVICNPKGRGSSLRSTGSLQEKLVSLGHG